MPQRFIIVVLSYILILTGCGQQAATVPQTAPVTSLPPSHVPLTATMEQAAVISATPTQPDFKSEPGSRTPQPIITHVITPSVTLLFEPMSFLTAVSFVDSQHGWVGFGASLLATNDGGDHWSTRFTAPETIDALDFVSTRQGWALSGKHLFATNDGGTSWNQLVVAHTGRISTIDFVDTSHGWIATVDADANSSLFRTTDGGTTWQQVVQPCNLLTNGYYGGSFSFIDPQMGWVMCRTDPAGGMQGKELFRTNDGGLQWTSVVRAEENVRDGNRLDQNGYLASMFFLDATHGWYSARFIEAGGLFGSADGGQTWQGWNLSIYGRTANLIRFISPTQGYVILDHRALVTTSDGGATWRQLYPAIAPQGAVSFVDPLQGFATSSPLDPYAILRTSDGGRSWTPIASVRIDWLTAFVFSDQQHGCIEGNSYEKNETTEVIYRTSDGGVSWETASPTDQCVTETPGASTIWRVERDQLLFSADNGATWTAYDLSATGFPPRLVSAIDAMDAWYMDTANHLYVTNDGGLHWTQLS